MSNYRVKKISSTVIYSIFFPPFFLSTKENVYIKIYIYIYVCITLLFMLLLTCRFNILVNFHI